MYMKRFIEKLKRSPVFYLDVMTFTILTFALIVFYSNLSSKQDRYGEYKSYYNIAVEIKDRRINGKLNKYIDLKYKNNICYIENCGFPHEGEFQLSSIHIWEEGWRKYVFKICINEEKDCFYNITNEFIHALKEEELNSLEDDIKDLWVVWCSFILFKWLHIKYIRKFFIMIKWQRRKGKRVKNL